MKLVHEHEVLQGKKREMPVTIHFPVKFWSKDQGCFIEETRKSSVALDPDRYLQLQGKGWLTLFVEVDRGTESLVSANDDVKSWNKTLRKYITVIENDEFNYRKYLGIKSNARVLLVFNSLSKMQAVQKLLDDATRGKGKDYFLFKVWPDFSFPFFVPGEPNWTLFEGPWDRVGHPPFGFV